MKDRKKYPNLNPEFLFMVSKPRFVKAGKSSLVTKFSLYSEKQEGIDPHIEEGISHAIYDIEIANSRALARGKKE